MSKTKIALIQMKMSSDPKKNRDDALSKIKLAVSKGAKIVCLPELFLTKYFASQKNTKILIMLKEFQDPLLIFFDYIKKI